MIIKRWLMIDRSYVLVSVGNSGFGDETTGYHGSCWCFINRKTKLLVLSFFWGLGTGNCQWINPLPSTWISMTKTSQFPPTGKAEFVERFKVERGWNDKDLVSNVLDIIVIKWQWSGAVLSLLHLSYPVISCHHLSMSDFLLPWAQNWIVPRVPQCRIMGSAASAARPRAAKRYSKEDVRETVQCSSVTSESDSILERYGWSKEV